MAGKAKFFWKRIGIALGVLAIAILGFYFWQPYRIDLIEYRPDKPLPRIPIEQVGLLEPGRRVLVVTGHPDDEAYYIGGTLFALKEKGARVKLVVLTNGDKGYYPFSDSEGLARIRKEEEREGASLIGAEAVVFFDEPDSRTTVDDELVIKLMREIDSFKPETILTFDPEYRRRLSHRDHRAAGEATVQAARKARFHGWMMLFSTLGPNTAVDVYPYWNQVDRLLAVHKSQFHGERLVRIRKSVLAWAEEAGAEFGPILAEAFRAVKM